MGAGRQGAAVAVFARAPVPGQTKRRLIPALGPQGAASLHRRMLLRAVQTATAARVGPVTLWGAPDTTHPFFLDLATRFGVCLAAQRGLGLGERMRGAFAVALTRARCAIVIGSDCPDLRAQDLRTAARWLGQGDDAVLGPSPDGGYYLLGVRTAPPELFHGVAWGTSQVLDQSLRRMASLGWRHRLLPARNDVDTPEDLARIDPGALPAA